MAWTPSNLYVESMGSTTIYMAHVDGSITSGTDAWTSGIPDIISIMGGYAQASTAATNVSLAISFTATSGTITTTIPLNESGTPFRIWVVAGIGQDRVV